MLYYIYRNEERTKTMKTLNTLTTKELETTKALYAKYNDLTQKCLYLDHNEKRGTKAACTKAYNKLNRYLLGIGATEKEASNMLFNLVNA
jgi:hypothetical protein